MKAILFLILPLSLLILNPASIFSQDISFTQCSFNEALKKANASDKILFIQIGSDCEKCNQVADQGLTGEKTKQVFSGFICIKIPYQSDDYQKLSNQFLLNPKLPSSLFLGPKGDFLEMIHNRSTSLSSEYLQSAAVAMSKKDHPPLKKLTEKYSSGKYDQSFLRDYISELINYPVNIDSLVSEFVDQLKIADLDDDETIKLLMQTAPEINSKIYQLIRLNNEHFHRLFMSFPLNERIAINNKIISKSKSKAIHNRDLTYMNAVADFVSKSHENRTDGWKASRINMLDYYREIKDTVRYISNAESYYRQFIEKQTTDSIFQAEKNKFIDLGDGRRIKGGRLYTVGNQINSMAWTIYEMTDDPEILGRILKWSQRTLIYEYPPFHDTYAHILYKIGRIEEAIEYQQRAIDLHNANSSVKNVEMEINLEKMKQRDR